MNDARNAVVQSGNAQKFDSRKLNKRRIRTALVLASVALIAAGIALGDNLTIFQKAVFVCMECIGIG